MSAIQLPDCETIEVQEALLDTIERAEFIKVVGASGAGAIPEFVDERIETSEGLAKRLARYRRMLHEQARSIIASGRERISIERRRVEEKITTLMRYRSERPNIDNLVMDDLQRFLSTQVFEEAGAKFPEPKRGAKTLWARIKSFLRYVVAVIASYLSRAWRRIRSLFSRRTDSTEKRRLRAPLGIPSRFGRVFALWRDSIPAAEVDRLMRSKGLSRENIRAMKRVDPDGYRLQTDIALAEAFKERRKEIEKEARELEKRHKQEDAEKREREKIEIETLKRKQETLIKQDEEMEREIRSKMEDEAKKRVRKDVVDEMVSAGYLKEEGERITITPTLIDRYASLIFLEEAKTLGIGLRARTTSKGMPTGTYERGMTRSRVELDRLDIVNTCIYSRLRNPNRKISLDEDVAIVAKEQYASTAHVVILLDKSGSMGENQRLENAKRAVMALYKAVKSNDPKSIVDVLTFDNEVRAMDLFSIWKCEPGSFTNTGEALKKAGEILRYARTDRKVIYLITDGLPESYTEANGRAVAGDLVKSMQYAEDAALALRKLKGLRFVTILLEAYDAKYVQAAERVSSILNGSIYTVEGRQLAKEMLRDYLVRDKRQEPMPGSMRRTSQTKKGASIGS